MHCVTFHVQTCNHSCVSGCARHPKGRPLSCHADTQQVLWVEHTSGLLSLWHSYTQDKIERLTLHYFFFPHAFFSHSKVFPSAGWERRCDHSGEQLSFWRWKWKNERRQRPCRWSQVSVCVCVFTLHRKPATPTRVTQLTVWESLHRNATVVIEARQAVMKIFEDYTQSWYWILMWVFSRQQFFLHACLLETWHAVF